MFALEPHALSGRIARALLACALGLLVSSSRAAAQPPGMFIDPFGRLVPAPAVTPGNYWGYALRSYQLARMQARINNLNSVAASRVLRAQGAYLEGISEVVSAQAQVIGAEGQYMAGMAQLTLAQGEFLKKREEANLLREEVRERRMENRKRQLDLWEWERDFNAGILNRARARQRTQDEIYYRDDASHAEITSGKSLNVLYEQLSRRQELTAANALALTPEMLEHVNVTVDGRGNLGLLKLESMPWPSLLLLPEFGKERDELTRLLKQAKESLPSSASDAGVMRKIRALLARWEKRVDELNGTTLGDPEWTPTAYTEARRHFKNLRDLIGALGKANAGYLLAPPKGENVFDLVRYMEEKGLHFAPALEGGEHSYVSLHTALANQVRRLQGQAPPTPRP